MKRLTISLMTVLFLSLLSPFFQPTSLASNTSEVRVYLNNERVQFSHGSGLLINERVYVPMRGVFEKLGAKVKWDAKTETIEGTYEDKKIELKVGATQAIRNGKTIKLDAPATIINSTTYVPLRFIGESLGAQVTWRSATQSVHINQGKLPFVFPPAPPVAQTKSVNVGGKTYTIQTIELQNGSNMHIGFANKRFGQTAHLEQIAKTYQASAAINGTYFEAYGGIPEPWGTLVSDGQVQHIGSIGATLGLTRDGKAFIDNIRLKVEGTAEGSHGWYAYNFNRTPSKEGSAVIIFTPTRGKDIGISYGTSVVVNNGAVTAIKKDANVQIPSTGYVIHFTGVEQQLANRFKVGAKVDYQVKYFDQQTNKELTHWQDVYSAVGAGPMLIKDGQVRVNPKAEGFVEDKILTQASTRSAIGVKKDGTIILTTTSGATIQNWAEIMKQLGAYQAINLDGGASSGLYVNNQYVYRPGRELSNIVWFD
ncbi:phosphodiester glycosidase family protein [Caldalkalibacillus horti]|uniref:Exopolysaccharide biosynthesis protein n=1 Tax=Caldalkalibacillus horti TaxID=77523 RepID=A0ABT9W2P9_9BACI|nr:phosphodiester glycosidase family protein [Bacillus horti]MDQ0167405.1 exopolysaccharide biosynthesis protein [Bacillus horti]